MNSYNVRLKKFLFNGNRLDIRLKATLESLKELNNFLKNYPQSLPALFSNAVIILTTASSKKALITPLSNLEFSSNST